MICIKCGKEVPDGTFCILCGAKQEAPPRGRRRGNHQGSVTKRGKTWMAVVSHGGYVGEDGKYHQRRVSKGGFKTKAEAVAYIPTLVEQGAEKPKTFSFFRETYEAGPYTKLSESKQTAYKIAFRRWGPIMNREPKTMTIKELQDTMDAAVSTYYPARDMQSVLSHMYKIAMAEQEVSINLARLLTLPDLEEEEPVPFSEIELHKLWDAYGTGSLIYGYILLMIYTGMMPGELLQLREEMIDFDRREITGCGLKTKKRKSVPIVIPTHLMPVVEYLTQSHSRGGKVVIWSRDRFYREYHKALTDAGIRDLPPYSCRHTTATALALGNIVPSTIQKVMRHSKFSSTQRYIHVTTTETHAAVNALLPDKPQKRAAE